MKRWLVLAPDATHAKAVYEDLRAAGVEAGHIHLFARDNADLAKAGLPKPTEMEQAMVSGEGMGGFLSGMMGAARPDPRIKEFGPDIDAGSVLLVVVFPKDRALEINAVIERHKNVWSEEASAAVEV